MMQFNDKISDNTQNNFPTPWSLTKLKSIN